MKYFFVLITIFLSFKSYSAEEMLAYDSKNLWVGPTVSFFVGFGVGVGLQGRFEERGIYYGIADGLGAASLILGTAKCNSPQKEAGEYHEPCSLGPEYNAGIYLFFISRALQIIDSSIWSFQYYNKYRTIAFVLPKEDGLSLNYAIEF